VEASPRTVAQGSAEDIAEASPRTVAQGVEDIAEAFPRTVAQGPAGMPLAGQPFAEQALAEQPLARPVRLLFGPSDRLRISRRSVRCFPIDRHNCCKMPYYFSLLKPNSFRRSDSSLICSSLICRCDCHDAAFHIGHALGLGSQSEWLDVDGLPRLHRAVERGR
jgi:hypothetical protein